MSALMLTLVLLGGLFAATHFHLYRTLPLKEMRSHYSVKQFNPAEGGRNYAIVPQV